MFDKILVGTVVWLASNETGRKIAKKGYKVLVKLGDHAVDAMPDDVGNIFSGTEKFIKNLTTEDTKTKKENENV